MTDIVFRLGDQDALDIQVSLSILDLACKYERKELPNDYFKNDSPYGPFDHSNATKTVESDIARVLVRHGVAATSVTPDDLGYPGFMKGAYCISGLDEHTAQEILTELKNIKKSGTPTRSRHSARIS